MKDLHGEETDVLCVKGSGWDMGVIEPAGLPAVRLDNLKKLRKLDGLSDEDMVKVQRANLLDPMAPNPSVETLLHAFVPHKFVDHTHSTAVLGIVDQPNSRELCDELYNGRMGFVRYIMPGFGLAKESADVFDKNPKVEGLILDKHGIFTFGEDAREAYERMIEMVTHRGRAAEEEPQIRVRHRANAATRRRRSPRSRRSCAARSPCPIRKMKAPTSGWCSISAPTTRSSISSTARTCKRYALAGVITPDHTIRTKDWPMIAPAPDGEKLADFRKAARDAAAEFVAHYKEYFERNNTRFNGGKVMLDPAPRTIARSRPRPVRSRPLEERCEDRGRSRRSRGRRHHRCRSDRHLHADRRRGHVRLRILVARTGQARQRERAAARRPGRGDHRRRRRDRRCDREGIRGGRRGSGVARSRRECRQGKSQGHRRRGAWPCNATSPTTRR